MGVGHGISEVFQAQKATHVRTIVSFNTLLVPVAFI